MNIRQHLISARSTVWRMRDMLVSRASGQWRDIETRARIWRKRAASFVSYHNAVPVALAVFAVGASGAFAATTAGVLPLPAIVPPREEAPEQLPLPKAVEMDVFALLSANMDTFPFRPTVTGVAENDAAYIVSYALSTLSPEDTAWVQTEKTGEFTISKDTLNDDDVAGIVRNRLLDIEAREREYLTKAQDAERRIARERSLRPAHALSGLVGLSLEQLPEPVFDKPIPVPVSEPITYPQQTEQEHASLEHQPIEPATTTESIDTHATTTSGREPDEVETVDSVYATSTSTGGDADTAEPSATPHLLQVEAAAASEDDQEKVTLPPSAGPDA